MKSKLTLLLDKKIIARAKKYAASNMTSLSNLIVNFIVNDLLNEKVSPFEISPYVKSISSGKKISDDRNWKAIRKDYTEYLEKKHR